MTARFWSELTTEDLARRDMGRAIAVLPVAAIEQHGPHLPLATDTLIAEGYLARVRDHAPPDLDVLLLPVQPVGKSDEHDSFPGTLSLDTGTALAAWTGIGAAVHRAGCRKLVLVTSHGGNSGLIDLVAAELRARFRMVAVTTSWARLGYPEGLFPADEIAHGIHAGGIETALMMPSIMSGSLMRDTPPSARMSAGTRSSAITATAPASSAILACSGVTTSMMTPPLSISAIPRLTRAVPTA